ncbi:dimethyl sulfoxide reductase anchor subunit family protein [Acidobacteriota bacterium]
MLKKEWPLIAFTLLTQLAVGFFLVAGFVYVVVAGRDAERTGDEIINPILPVIIAILALGAISASLHLGKPMRAVRAAVNIRTSWLSREMVTGMFFGLLCCLFGLIQFFDMGPKGLRIIVVAITALSGLALVFAIARLYMLRTVPVWNRPATPVSFFLTTFLLGTAATCVGLVVIAGAGSFDGKNALVTACVAWSGPLVLLAAIIQLVVTVMHTAYSGERGSRGDENSRFVLSRYRPIFVLRLIFAVAGAGMFMIFTNLYSTNAIHDRFTVPMVLGAFALLFVSEIMGRFLFYASYRRVGL